MVKFADLTNYTNKMKRIAYLAFAITAILMSGCSKTEIDSKDLVGSYWTGTLHHSSAADDEYDSISFEFDKGHADFTYLEYATNDLEEGVALYEAEGESLNISKANDIIDGTWTVTGRKAERMTLERETQSEKLTMELIRRK